MLTEEDARFVSVACPVCGEIVCHASAAQVETPTPGGGILRAAPVWYGVVCPACGVTSETRGDLRTLCPVGMPYQQQEQEQQQEQQRRPSPRFLTAPASPRRPARRDYAARW